jgi:phosphonate metabolism protein PhnN/1,5-bisphosphokinase (PRPP-forming)
LAPDRIASDGTLILVVGPSGAGKDSVIAGAAAALRDDTRFLFARRAITRPSNGCGEDHLALSVAEFATRRAAGGFLLAWHAHGLDYGLPVALAEDLAAGRVVVANVSRAVVAAARLRWKRTRVVLVTAAASVLAQRLAARARENEAAIRLRLERAASLMIAADATIANEGSLSEAVAAFVTLLRDAGSQAASRTAS